MSSTVTADDEKWLTLYPIYIDVGYSQGKGRRIAKEFALVNPTATEMVKAVEALDLPCSIESEKRHCATPRVHGRVRFQLKMVDGSLWNDKIDNKQTLLLMIANNIASTRKEDALKAPPQIATAAAKGKKGKK